MRPYSAIGLLDFGTTNIRNFCSAHLGREPICRPYGAAFFNRTAAWAIVAKSPALDFAKCLLGEEATLEATGALQTLQRTSRLVAKSATASELPAYFEVSLAGTPKLNKYRTNMSPLRGFTILLLSFLPT